MKPVTISNPRKIIAPLAFPTSGSHVRNSDSVEDHPVSKELKDSIRFASYIQQSIFGMTNDFEEGLDLESFLLYMPRDIVSGDFYWTYEILNKKIVVVGDCTGHGVPGAMLTIFAHSAMNRAVVQSRLTDPAVILEQVNNYFNETFCRKHAVRGMGMDATVCVFDKKSMQLDFAGAFHPLWIVRDTELMELKGSRASVGALYNPDRVFTTETIALKPGDNVYLFSDGFEDQFGGTDGKKFLKKNFKKTLLSVATLNMRDQKRMLQQVFEDWKADFEQVDDVCVMGIKIRQCS